MAGTAIVCNSRKKTQDFLLFLLVHSSGWPALQIGMRYVYIHQCADGKYYDGSTKDFKDQMAVTNASTHFPSSQKDNQRHYEQQ
jgi:hypothetical protein